MIELFKKEDENLRLDVEAKGEGKYLCIAEGCHLKYFVVFIKDAKVLEEYWKLLDEQNNNYYEMIFDLEKNKTYEFHVYDGNKESNYKGKMFFTT